jgi:hypothetical protein
LALPSPPPPLPPQKRWEPWMATSFVSFCILHHRKVVENLSHSDLNVSPQPPPCPLAWPATTNASPRPERRLDNIVGQTQDTRERGRTGGSWTHRDSTNAISSGRRQSATWQILAHSTKTLRCVANRHKTNSIRTPHRKHRAGEGRASVTHYPAPSIPGGTPGDRHPARISGHLKKVLSTGTKIFQFCPKTILILPSFGSIAREAGHPVKSCRRSSEQVTTTHGMAALDRISRDP